MKLRQLANALSSRLRAAPTTQPNTQGSPPTAQRADLQLASSRSVPAHTDETRPSLATDELRMLLWSGQLSHVSARLEGVGSSVANLVERFVAAPENVSTEFLPELRALARLADPVCVQFIPPAETRASIPNGNAAFAVVKDSVPIHWFWSSGEAWSRRSCDDGVLVSMVPTVESTLVELSFGGGVLVDPDRVGCLEPVAGMWLDPLTMENWAVRPPDAPVDTGQVDVKATAVTTPHFAFVGGDATFVLHDTTTSPELAREDGDRAWILEDRLVESADWVDVALCVGHQLHRIAQNDAFGLVWRSPHVAGPIVKLGKKRFGAGFTEAKLSFHEETGRNVTHDLVRPSADWAWVRSFFTAPTRKLASVNGGWTADGPDSYSICPTVLVVASVESEARMAEMLNSMPALRWVVLPDTGRMRRFAQLVLAGASFDRSLERVPLLDDYRWKHVERGAAVNATFRLTAILDEHQNWVSGTDSEPVLEYLATNGQRLDLLNATADPLVQRVAKAKQAKRGQPQPSTRAVAVAEQRLAAYRAAWERRGSCLFYELKKAPDDV